MRIDPSHQGCMSDTSAPDQEYQDIEDTIERLSREFTNTPQLHPTDSDQDTESMSSAISMTAASSTGASPAPATTASTSTVTYKSFGGTSQPNTAPIKEVREEVLITKAARAKLSDDAKMKSLDRVKAEQQTALSSVTVSASDPTKLLSSQTLVSLLTEHKSNLKQHDLLDPHTVVKPNPESFNDKSTDFRTLQANGNEPITHDPFTACMKLTADDVARSSKWHSWFPPEDKHAEEDLSWSPAHCKKSAKPELCQKVCTRMQKCDPASHGGPSFLKLAPDQISTTGEANPRTLITITETHSIKSHCPGEDVSKATDLFETICNTMDTIRDGTSPPDGVLELVRILQTTSVPEFDAQFAKKEIDCNDQEIHRSIDPDFACGDAKSDLKNDIRTATWMLLFADRHCAVLRNNLTWEKHIQAPPGASAFNARHDDNDNPTADGAKPEAPPFVWTKNCFNCGGDHLLKKCPCVMNSERIEANKLKHPVWKRRIERRHVLRPPEAHENGRRVIEGKPHVHDPAGGPRQKGRWNKEDTPSDGQPDAGGPPKAHHQSNADAGSALGNGSVMMPPAEINPSLLFGDASTIALPSHLVLTAAKHTCPSFCGTPSRRRRLRHRRRLHLLLLSSAATPHHVVTGDLGRFHRARGLRPPPTHWLQITQGNARFFPDTGFKHGHLATAFCPDDIAAPLSTPTDHNSHTAPDTAFSSPPGTTSFPDSFDVLHHGRIIRDLTTTMLPRHCRHLPTADPSHGRLPTEAKSLQSILRNHNEDIHPHTPTVCVSSRTQELPTVVDAGASCSVTPRAEDFVAQPTVPDTNRIEGPNGQSSEVAGVGSARWDAEDAQGTRDFIQTTAHFVPQANVRLFSPQVCILEQHANGNHHCKMTLAGTGTTLTLANGTTLTFPIQKKSNLPMMLTHKALQKPPQAQHQRHVRSADGFHNLVTHLLSAAFKTFDAQVAFCTSNSTPAPHRIGDGPAVLSKDNWNASPAQQELLLWHQRLGHIGMDHVQTLPAEPQNPKERRIIQPSDDKSSHCHEPLCEACQCAKQKRRNPPSAVHKSRPQPEGALSRDVSIPGQLVSVDLHQSGSEGRPPNAFGKEKDDLKCAGGAAFVSHAAEFMHTNHQHSTTVSETVNSKHQFEHCCDSFGISVKQHVGDDNPFHGAEWRDDCALQGQALTKMSGVGAHHQNLSERCNQPIFDMARAMMIHFAMHWPQVAQTDLWPLAATHATCLWNHTPRARSTGSRLTRLSPMEHFTGTLFDDCHHLQRLHAFGCPVRVLDPRLQDGKKLPEWERRSRQAVCLGCSQVHSATVHLVLNPHTGHISPQCHVVFDDAFSAIFSNGTFTRDVWDSLSVSDIERHPDASEAPDTTSFDFDSDDGSAVEREQTQTPQPQAETPQPQAAPRAPLRVSFDLSEDASTPSTLTPEDHASIPEPSLPSGPEGASSEGPPASSPEGASASPRPPEGAPHPAPPVLRRSTRTRRQPQRLTLTTASPSPPEPTGSQQVAFNGSAELPRVPGERLNQQHPANPNWDRLIAMTTRIRGAPGALTSECNEHRSHTKLTECPNPASFVTLANKEDAPTFKEAMAGPDQAGFLKAMRIEVDTLDELDVCDPVTRTPDMKVPSSAWAFERKRFPDGSARKLKARFCARGFEQQEGVDHFETFAPVVMWMTVRLLLIMSVLMKLETKQIDCAAAFVHAPIDCTVCVECPKLFEVPGKVWKLKKSLHGPAQSPRDFFLRTKSQSEDELGFAQSTADPCLFVSPGVICSIRVDDASPFCKNSQAVENLTTRMKHLKIQFREEETVAGFLGAHADRKGDEIHLTQSGLIDRTVASLHSDDASVKAVETPSAGHLPIDKEGEPPQGAFSCASIVGQLDCLQGHSRPDVAMATSQAARFPHTPRRSHELAVIRIGRCLKGARDRGITLKPTDPSTLSMDVFADAAFACGWNSEQSANPDSVKSRTGCIVEVAGCPALWVSELQSTIATGTMESECTALSMAMRAFIPLLSVVRAVIEGLSHKKQHEITFKATAHEDNQGALILANLEPGRHTVRSKFCALRLHWFRSWVHNPANNVKIQFVETSKQKADFLTRSLPAMVLKVNRELSMGWQRSKSTDMNRTRDHSTAENCIRTIQAPSHALSHLQQITTSSELSKPEDQKHCTLHVNRQRLQSPSLPKLHITRMNADQDNDKLINWIPDHGPTQEHLRLAQDLDSVHCRLKATDQQDRLANSLVQLAMLQREPDPIQDTPATRKAPPAPKRNFLDVKMQPWMGNMGKTGSRTERDCPTCLPPHARLTRNSSPAHRQRTHRSTVSMCNNVAPERENQGIETSLTPHGEGHENRCQGTRSPSV